MKIRRCVSATVSINERDRQRKAGSSNCQAGKRQATGAKSFGKVSRVGYKDQAGRPVIAIAFSLLRWGVDIICQKILLRRKIKIDFQDRHLIKGVFCFERKVKWKTKRIKNFST